MLLEQRNDLRYNYAALCLALTNTKFMLPEYAFLSLDAKPTAIRQYKRYTLADVEDMAKLKDQGLSWSELGRIYGTSPSSLHRAVKHWRLKNAK